MPRKITIEAQVETNKARKDLASLGSAAEQGMAQAASASEKMATAAERAAGAMSSAARSSAETASGTQNAAGAFSRMAGMMTGVMSNLAAKFAAREFGEDSVAAAAAQYVGNMATSAASFARVGSMIGGAPGAMVGLGVGAASGVADTYLQRDSEEKARIEAKERENVKNRELLETMHQAEDAAERFRSQIAELSDKALEKTERLDKASRLLEDAIERQNNLDRQLLDLSDKTGGNSENFARAMRQRQQEHGQVETLKTIKDALEKQVQNPGSERNFAAVADTLSRLGLSTAANPATERLVDIQEATRKEVQGIRTFICNSELFMRGVIASWR